jgi:hypothetical protein
MGQQIYVFMKRPKDDLWSYESFRNNMEAANNSIKEHKKLGYTKFRIVKLPIRGR